MPSRIRIQPPLVEVPDENPFENDLLGRKEFAETLASTLRAIEGPGVFAIDGGWGTGKTTFVRMFSQHLRNEGFRVVDINAWETDYADSPLAALISKVAEAEPDRARGEKFKAIGVQALKAALPAAVKIATYGMVDIDAASERVVGDALAKFAEGGLARFDEDAQSMAKFKESLQDLAARCEDKPLLVIVDELDRCRPTYAVEMLETIKHVFDADNLLFVLAVNRRQLDQSATTLYGASLDPETYFTRFFDVELRLPEPDRKDLVRHILRGHGLSDNDAPADMLADFLAASPCGIRVITQTLQRYALVRASLQHLEDGLWWWILPTVVLLRLIEADAFRAFVAGQLPDTRLLDDVFQRDWARPLRGTGAANLMEAAVAIVWSTAQNEQSEVIRSAEEASASQEAGAMASGDSIMYWYGLLGGRQSRWMGRILTEVVRRVETFTVA